MKLFGDLVIINGKILNMAAEIVDSDPEFNAADEGIIIYNSTERSYKYNNGSTWVTFQVSIETSNTLLTTLGDVWINSDFTFNPNPFNSLNTVTGLTSDDSLFDVLTQFDQKLQDALDVTTIRGIDVPAVDSLSENDVIFFNGISFQYGQISELGTPNVSINDLSDVTIDEPTTNDILILSESGWVNKQVWFKYENFAATSTTFVVDHGLNNRFCHITIINPQSGEKVLDSDIDSITYNTADRITVELNSTIPVVILVTSFDIASD